MRSLGLSLLLVPGLALAQSGDPKTYFEGVYDQLSNLTLTKDANGLQKLFKATATPDFVYYPVKGAKQSGTELMASMRAQLKAFGKVTKSTQKIDKIVIKGDTATLSVSSVYAMDIPMNGKTGKLAGTSLTSDTWINTPKGWKLKEIRTVKENATLNGKSILGG
ncbi:hypothetical protein BH11ARM2_BH11ARM2_37300 [soil metagenome]